MRVKRRTIVAGAALLAGLSGGQAAAQASDAIWMCASEVAGPDGIGMTMGLLGPGLRRTAQSTIYVATFRSPIAQQSHDAVYEAAFGQHMASRGQGGGTVSCGIKASDAAVQSALATLTGTSYVGYTGAGGIKVTRSVVRIDWRPADVAAAPPPPAVAAAPAPAQAVSALGAAFEDLGPQAAAIVRLDPAAGALVMAVEAGGKAEIGGLKRMDVVTEIAGQRVDRAVDVITIVGRMRPGFVAPVKVWRGGATTDLNIEIAALPVQAPPAPAAQGGGQSSELKAALQAALDRGKGYAAQAHTAAEEGKAMAAQARAAAVVAQDAAQRGEKKEAGYSAWNGLTAARVKYRHAGGGVKEAPAGPGVRTYEDGETVAGQFDGRFVTGLGVNRLVKGTVYEGEMDKFQREGLGVLTAAQGWVYAGRFAAGRTALGVFTNSTEPPYVEFAVSTLKGQQQSGVMILRDGRQQIGEFFSEKLTGLGAEYDASGKLLRQGFWAAGELKTPIAESAALTGAPAPATPVPGGPQ